MAKIFISYRREDAGFAVDQVHGALKPYAASADDIFVDVDNIPPGVDFVEHLNKYVDQCDVMLVAIGVNWLRAVDASGARRLDDREDFVRIEIETALARGIPVVPLLLGGAKLPGEEELPESLRPLIRKQAVEIPRGGVQPAIDRMMRGLGIEPVKTVGGLPGWLVPLAAVLVLAAGGFGLWQSGVLDPADQPVEVAAVETDDDAETSDAERDEANEREAARQQEIRDEEAAERQRQADMMAKRQREKDTADEAAQTRREAIVLAARYPVGSKFRDTLSGGGKGPEMVVVPAGSFVMGSSLSENERDDDEGPQQRITITRPFAVSKFEVTWTEWEACVSDGGCSDNSNKGHSSTATEELRGDRGWGRGNRPVINVSWEDAQAYVQWLSNKTGEGYRLLSEVQWEYAARAGSTGRFSWGDGEPTCTKGRNNSANYSSCSSDRTEPTGYSAANAFGLYDMHGNVWEWVEDCYESSYDSSSMDASAHTHSTCSLRVFRGGSWSNSERIMRSANRNHAKPSNRDGNLGFRIKRYLSE